MKAVGQVHISYSVVCPNCDYMHDNDDDSEWFDETMGGGFPCEQSAFNSDYEAECKECKQHFTINGFIH